MTVMMWTPLTFTGAVSLMYFHSYTGYFLLRGGRADYFNIKWGCASPHAPLQEWFYLAYLLSVYSVLTSNTSWIYLFHEHWTGCILPITISLKNWMKQILISPFSVATPDQDSAFDESEDDVSSPSRSLERQSQHRANTTVPVCWHRNTSVSMSDHIRAVQVRALSLHYAGFILKGQTQFPEGELLRKAITYNFVNPLRKICLPMKLWRCTLHFHLSLSCNVSTNLGHWGWFMQGSVGASIVKFNAPFMTSSKIQVWTHFLVYNFPG